MQVLDAIADRETWLQRWQACGREPFAHPSYCTLFTGNAERALALVVESGHSFALLPLIIRPVPTSLGLATELHDATSPYGYGGPFISGALDVEEVMIEVEEWAAREGLCSAFLRLSLELNLPAQMRTERTHVAETADNVIVDLQRSPDEIWTNYQHKVRKNVKKALRAGCRVQRDDSLDDVDAFLDVYAATMERRNASRWYRFDRTFFVNLGEVLRGSYSVFSVRDAANKVVSVELVLRSDAYLYSFLGGTLEEAFPVSPNDLLKHEVSLFGHQTGRRGYVLGGGYQKDDGVFRYKKAFDPQGIRGFRTARVVGSPHRYETLVAAHCRQAGIEPNSVFFPAYRAPIARHCTAGEIH